MVREILKDKKTNHTKNYKNLDMIPKIIIREGLIKCLIDLRGYFLIHLS